LKDALKSVIDNNELYELIKNAESSNVLRKRAVKLTMTHSGLKILTPMFLGLMVSSVLFPVQALVNLGLSKSLQLTIFTSLFVVSKMAEGKYAYKKALAWNDYSSDVSKNLTHELIKHVQSLPMAYIESQSTEKLMALVKSDADTIVRFLNYTPGEFTDKATTIALGSAVVAAISPIAFLLCFIPVPLIAKLNKKQQKALAEHAGDSAKLDEQFNQVLSNNLSGISTVKSFTAEPLEIDRLKHMKSDLTDKQAKVAEINSYYGNLNEFLFMMGLSVPLIYNCINVLSNNIGMTTFMIQNGTVPSILTASTGLEYGKSLYRDASAAANRLNTLMAVQPELNHGELTSQSNIKGDLIFDNISFEYNSDSPVLNQVNLNIPSTGKIAFVGPTGSGKSTLMKLLLRFYDVHDGSITLDGNNINDIDLKHLRQSIGLVSQDPFLFNGSIYENLLYGRPDATFEEVVQACKIAHAYDFIQAKPEGFDAQIGERGNKLSGGQRQRLSIARAVLKRSSILILDEATSAVDNETEAAIRESVELISKNITVIIIAHRLSTIRYVDTIYHLKNGQITESGDHETLLKLDGDYASLWRLQTAQQFRSSMGQEDGIVIDNVVDVVDVVEAELDEQNKQGELLEQAAVNQPSTQTKQTSDKAKSGGEKKTATVKKSLAVNSLSQADSDTVDSESEDLLIAEKAASQVIGSNSIN